MAKCPENLEKKTKQKQTTTKKNTEEGIKMN